MAANGISTLATKQAKQAAKLALAATKRAAKGLPSNLDMSLLPTQYSNNTLVINSHPSGLAAGRPWTSGPAVSYSFGTIPTSINEGSAGTFNVTTTGVANGTTLYWTITVDGFALKTSDFNATSGSFTITSNAGSFTVTPAADAITDYSDTFQVKIRTGSTSGTVVATSSSVTINDTSIEPWRPLPAGMTEAAPVPGSGAYLASMMLGPGTSGTPQLASISGLPPPLRNSGLALNKYVGAPWTAGNFASEFDSSFFTNPAKGPINYGLVADTHLGFGQISNLPNENGYTLEWQGYIEFTTPGTYDLLAFVNGDVAWWIENDARSTPSVASAAGYGTGSTFSGPIFNTNSFDIMTPGWLEVRMIYVNHTGDEQCQLMLHDCTTGAITNGIGLTTCYDTTTGGI